MTRPLPRRFVVPALAATAVCGALALGSGAPASAVPSVDRVTTAAATNGRIFFVDGSTGQLTSTTATGAGRRTYAGAAAHPSVSPDGTRVAIEFPTNRGIGVENADGTGLQTLVPDTGSSPSWSPDGTKIVYSDGNDIAVVTVATKAVVYLTHDGGATEEVAPAWSPNGTWIAFTYRGCDNGGGRCIVRINANGGGGRVVLTPNSGEIDTSDEADWSPGNQIVYSSGIGTSCSGAAGIDIWKMSASGGGKSELTCRPGVYNSDNAPTWAPNGRKIAFRSDERVDPDHYQLYVMNPDGSGVTYVDTGSTFGIADPDWGAAPTAQTTTLTLAATPTTVASGKTVKLSGQLTPASGQGYGGQKVTISSKPAGSSTYTVLKTVRTTSTGAWSTTVNPTSTTSYQASYAANSALGFGASTSAAVTVTVS